jgi:histidine ammonia-lyase
MLNHRVHPVVPSRGLVGTSGDLAPLAHLSLVLTGEGEAWQDRARESGAAALQRAGLTPVALGPKEGVALINGTQASTAVLALALAAAERLARTADVAAAMSIDGLQGSTRAGAAGGCRRTALRVPGDRSAGAAALVAGARARARVHPRARADTRSRSTTVT